MQRIHFHCIGWQFFWLFMITSDIILQTWCFPFYIGRHLFTRGISIFLSIVKIVFSPAEKCDVLLQAGWKRILIERTCQRFQIIFQKYLCMVVHALHLEDLAVYQTFLLLMLRLDKSTSKLWKIVLCCLWQL